MSTQADDVFGQRISIECKLLVFHRGLTLGTPDGQQAMPITESRAALQRQSVHPILIRARDDLDRVQAVRSHEPNVIIDFRHWSEAPDDIRRSLHSIRQAAPDARYVLMDYYAPTCSPHLGLVDDVDIYAKRQVLTDASAYDHDYVGGYIFTDFLVRKMGFNIGGWHFGARISRDQAKRVVPTWNLGAVARYAAIARLGPLQIPWRLRPIGLNARVGLRQRTAHEEWYQQYRRLCIQSTDAYTRRVRRSGQGRLPTKRYYAELAASRVAFSPFGWGEVCFRDYEAVASGCLLLKQDMSHIRTEPDIYRPMETYVPVRWDLADLHEQLDWIFRHPADAAHIAYNGRRTLNHYFRSGGPLRAVLELIRRAAEQPQPRPADSIVSAAPTVAMPEGRHACR